MKLLKNTFHLIILIAVAVGFFACSEDSPTIENQSFSVSEVAFFEDTVGSVVATNPTSSELIYEIIAGNDDNKFILDEDNGQITLASLLDYETTPTYELTVKVMTKDNPSTEATAIITINVEDGCSLDEWIGFYTGTCGENTIDLEIMLNFLGNGLEYELKSYSSNGTDLSGSDLSELEGDGCSVFALGGAVRTLTKDGEVVTIVTNNPSMLSDCNETTTVVKN